MSNLIGRLCIYKNKPVIIVSRQFVDSFFYVESNLKYVVLFPHGGLESVSVINLKVIA